jgi:hypothetical protein
VILDYLPFGTQAIQQTFAREGRLWWPVLTTRAPDTWWKWQIKDGSPVALDVKGYSGDSVASATLPVSQLWLWVHRPTSDQDLYGSPMLRPAYRHWYAKGKLDVVRSIGHERFAMGTPVVGYNDKAPGADDLENAVKDLRVHERGYLMVPLSLVGGDINNVRILERTGGGDSSLNDTVRYHDQQIAASLMAQWMTLGSTETGSRAVGEVQVREALKRADSAARYVGEVYTEMVAQAIRHNFGGSAPVPAWTPSGIVEDDPTTIATYVATLQGAGMLTPSPDLEDYLRRVGRLPARPKPEAATDGPAEETSVTALSDAPTRRELTAIEARCLDVLAMQDAREDLGAEGVRIVEEWTTEARARASRYLRPLIEARDFGKIAAFEVGRRRDLQDRLVSIAVDAMGAGRKEAAAELKRQAKAELSAVPPSAVVEAAAFGVRRGDHSGLTAAVARGGAVSMYCAADCSTPEVLSWARSAGLLLAEEAPSMQRIVAAAKARADRIASEVQSEAINAAISAASTTPPNLAAFEDLLSRGAKLATAAAVSEVVGSGLAAGRADAAEAGVDVGGETVRPSRWIYSAILDSGTCEVCLSVDQQEAPTRAELPPVPNPLCLGGTSRCRCVHIGVIE